MKFGTTVRNMGAAATTKSISHCARHAEDIGLDSVWVVDHIAIPPDDAEGSDGRWFDPLATLAYLSAVTSRVQLGVSVLVLPYRPPLPTAKWIATIQELSNHRLQLGIGPGWMQAEFSALGIKKSARGRQTDECIDFIQACFSAENDIVTSNNQELLFRPKPPCPPVYVGGMTDRALERAVRCADAWMPMGIDPVKLKPRIEVLRTMAEEADRACPRIVTIGSFPDDQSLAVDQLRACQELGVSHYIQASRYATISEFEGKMSCLMQIKAQVN
jgi:probable F420-dependent oxidoreductase